LSLSYLFLDWAGDSGFKFDRGSTHHLVFAFAAVPDYTGFRRTIADLRVCRGLPRDYEYHYAHIPKVERAAYFATLHSIDFQAWVLVVDKRDLSVRFRRRSQYILFREFVTDLARRIPLEATRGISLLIDAHATTTRLTQTIRVAVSSALKTRGAQQRVKKARGRPAHREDGLQLADMVAGAVVESKVRDEVDYLIGLEDKIKIWWYEGDVPEK